MNSGVQSHRLLGLSQAPKFRPALRRWLPRRRSVEQVDFVVAGVQKAGTTALHHFLSQHPQVALPRDQALHFFDNEENFDNGGARYDVLRGNFAPGYRWQIAGEVTPDYLYYTPSLARLAEHNPGLKLIISLRNPADRAFSHWNMRRTKGREPLDFVDAIKHDQEMRTSPALRGNAHIDRGLYAAQLARVFELFPREQVLVIKYERFRKDFTTAVHSIFDFLGIARLSGLKNREMNVGPYQRRISPSERAYVASLFHEDIDRLEQMLGWDCSDWRAQPAENGDPTR